jgi:hypothetical protein
MRRNKRTVASRPLEATNPELLIPLNADDGAEVGLPVDIADYLVARREWALRLRFALAGLGRIESS